MFQDPGECHALKLPEREQNQWLRRAHRVSSVATPSTTSPSLSQSLSADTASHGQGNSSSYAGGEVTATGCRDAVSSVLPLTTPPGSPRPAPWRLPIQAREFRAEGALGVFGKGTGSEITRLSSFSLWPRVRKGKNSTLVLFLRRELVGATGTGRCRTRI